MLCALFNKIEHYFECCSFILCSVHVTLHTFPLTVDGKYSINEPSSQSNIWLWLCQEKCAIATLFSIWEGLGTVHANHLK